MLVGVGSRFVVSLIACCTRLLAHLIACAIKSFKNYFLHNEVVQLLVISAHEVCGSAQQSVWFCTTKLCSAANGGTQC